MYVYDRREDAIFLRQKSEFKNEALLMFRKDYRRRLGLSTRQEPLWREAEEVTIAACSRLSILAMRVLFA
jgi:hypothetical protein